MKSTVTICSLLLGLTFQASALASIDAPAYTPTSQHSVSLNQSETLEIAQRYVDRQYVIDRLYANERLVLNLAGSYNSRDASWYDMSVERLSEGRLKLNVYGDISRGNLRVGLYLRRNSQGDFYFYDYDWKQWGAMCRRPCKRRIRGKLKKLPNEYGRFTRVLHYDILR